MILNPNKVVLSIAGYDPSGGAGVLADIKTIGALGCYGLAVVTSITAQNTYQVTAAFHQSVNIVRAQLETLLTDFEISAVKIGMLPTAELADLVADQLTQHKLNNIVIDPVLRASSGFCLSERPINRSDALFRLANLLTPNLAEAAVLTGLEISSIEDMKIAARTLSEQFDTRPAVLMKGGHLKGDPIDVLWDGARIFEYQSNRIHSTQTHGTGCTLASAIAAGLARGIDLPNAIAAAKTYVASAIEQAPGLGKGSGPLQHFIKH